MANAYMTASDQSNKNEGSPVYEYKATLTAGITGDTILAEDGAGSLKSWVVALIISSGNGRVEYSTSNRDDIIAGNGNWKSWDAGNVSANEDDVLEQPNAVRAVCVSGTIKFEVIAS